MIWKSLVLLMFAFFCCALGASEVSDKKIETITQIVRGEFRKIVVAVPGKKIKPWQYEYENNPQKKKALYAKVGAAILAKVQAKVKPFNTVVKQDTVPKAAMTEINKKVAKRFSFKNAADIALGAIKEAELAYPLAQKGDDVTIRYYRAGIYTKISGKIQSVRNNGQMYEVNDKLVSVSEIVRQDRQYFDPVLNAQLRQAFIKDFQDPKKLAKLKQNYRNHLMAEELEKIVSNEKKGYIFFRDKWVTAKYVTEQIVRHYLEVTEKRLQVEATHFVRGGKAPTKKK